MTSPISKLVVFLSGPTGVGKSDVAIELAKLIGGEVVSCDSVQIYKRLDIGSNKTLQTEGIPHHMIDIVDFDSEYSAGHFYSDCTKCIEGIHERGNIPILVGGTGLYMKWILNGRPTSPETPSEIKQTVKEMLQEDGNNWQKSLDRLNQLDPDYASSLLPNDFYRLGRALEINLHSGRPLKEFQPPGLFNRSSFVHHLGWDCRCFYLSTNRKFLYHLIDYRCELMIKQGFFKELLELMQSGFNDSFPSGKSIGYFQGLQFLTNCKSTSCISFGEFKQKFLTFLSEFQAESRQYARSQDTWHWKDDRFWWIPRNSPTTQLVTFEDCEPVIYDESICTSIQSIASFLAPKISTLPLQQFNSDPQLSTLSCAARSHKSTIDKKIMKFYKTKLFIFDKENEIESQYQLLVGKLNKETN